MLEDISDKVDTPLKLSYSLRENPGWLRLYGNCYTLSSPEGPTMLLRKQTALSQCFIAKMIFNPSKAGYEAGIVVWWNMYSYASAGLTRSAVDGELYTVFRSPSHEKHALLVYLFSPTMYPGR
jgi:beta-xylosidase